MCLYSELEKQEKQLQEMMKQYQEKNPPQEKKKFKFKLNKSFYKRGNSASSSGSADSELDREFEAEIPEETGFDDTITCIVTGTRFSRHFSVSKVIQRLEKRLLSLSLPYQNMSLSTLRSDSKAI